MEEKLLNQKELRIALVGHGAPFMTPPTPRTIRGWVDGGLKTVPVPGRVRPFYRLSDVLAFLKAREVQP